ncbi:MAG: ABC transporter substrate-binding protein, partial [Dongiaceae bacterium]
MITRPGWLLACVCVLSLAAVACGRHQDRAYSRGSTLIVAYCCGGQVLNPNLPDMPAKFLVFIPLVTRNEKGELEGRLARSWEHSADYREWTYHLRRDIRWHDGRPVTAHDIKFTLDLLISQSYPIDSATLLDDWTIKVRAPAWSVAGLDTWLVYYPKHVIEHLDPKKFDHWDFWTRPVGNGPYRFVRYLPETMMEFEANLGYFRGRPKIQRVILKFAGEAGLNELLSGNVDAVPNAHSTQIPRLAREPRFLVYQAPDAYRSHAIYWRNDHPLFRDPQARRALTLAINRRELLRVRHLPEEFPIVDGMITDWQLRSRELPEPLPYDPVQAGALLDAAGWRDRNGDGIREREGKEFRFTALLDTTLASQEAAVYVQDQLRRVGVRMDLLPLAHPVIEARLESGEFEAALTIFVNKYFWLDKLHFGQGHPIGYKSTA